MKFDVPAAVGVPEIAPVAAFRVNPVGRAPAVIDQVIGAAPPVVCSVALYAELRVAFASVAVVTLTDPALIVMLKLAVAVAFVASVTFTVKFAVPDAVGVPEIVLPVRVRPAGRDPALTLQL